MYNTVFCCWISPGRKQDFTSLSWKPLVFKRSPEIRHATSFNWPCYGWHLVVWGMHSIFFCVEKSVEFLSNVLKVLHTKFVLAIVELSSDILHDLLSLLTSKHILSTSLMSSFSDSQGLSLSFLRGHFDMNLMCLFLEGWIPDLFLWWNFLVQ